LERDIKRRKRIDLKPEGKKRSGHGWNKQTQSAGSRYNKLIAKAAANC
jgi:hypothetical protein